MVKEYFLQLGHHWKILLKDKTYLLSVFVGILLYGAGQIVTFFASAYNDALYYTSVGDLLLDKIPTVNLEFIFVWGLYTIVVLIFIYPLFVKPEFVPFMLKTFGILMLVRACFILFTHIGPPAGFFYGNLSEMNPFFRNDLFFSGHVAVPFLAFLILKETKVFKWIMLLGAFIMAVTVLFMHVHYSIDVFAAFFITHGIYALSNKIFNDLNVRFKRRIRLYGWKAMKKRLQRMRERRGRLIIPRTEIPEEVIKD